MQQQQPLQHLVNLFIVVLLLILLLLPLLTYAQPFAGCDSAVYYNRFTLTSSSSSNTLPPTRAQLALLLQDTHRFTLSLASDELQVLRDLHSDGSTTTIFLPMRNRGVSVTSLGLTWQREYLWNVTTTTTTTTPKDVYNLIPMDKTVQSVRQSLQSPYFGTCSAVASATTTTTCTSPITPRTPLETSYSDYSFLPPATTTARGSIARKLFYMAVRYNWELTDCVSLNNHNNNQHPKMGYLSQLLEWHTQYPPTTDEIQQTDMACTEWQGNRNPFVDHPEWVTPLFGTPQATEPYQPCEDEDDTTTTGDVDDTEEGTDDDNNNNNNNEADDDENNDDNGNDDTTTGSDTNTNDNDSTNDNNNNGDDKTTQESSKNADDDDKLEVDENGIPSFSSCGRTDYYTSITDFSSRTQMINLLQQTHRRKVTYTDNSSPDADDVWKALVQLNAGTTTTTTTTTTTAETENTVRLIYSQIDVDAQNRGTAQTWNREHLWPKSRGVEDGGKDYTDLHHLVPADASVNTARSNKYFGACDAAGDADDNDCRQPATDEAAQDTEASRTTFLPPASVRGDIARAMFYMDLRYSGNADGELDLILTDCPDRLNETHMGYLSELLQWHIDDPVTEEERIRNDRVCNRWQGNRNPFVDFEDLATSFFGNPQSKPYDCPDAFDDENTQPEQSTSCMRPGSLMTVGFNSDQPDTLAFLALDDVPGGMLLYATDNGWTGEDFRTNEGVIRLRIPDRGLPAGTVFGYGDTRSDPENEFGEYNWERTKGSFALSASGDTVLLYCYDENDGLTFISGLSYGRGWENRGGDTTFSALPDQLANSFVDTAVTLIHYDNYRYKGPTTGTITFLRAEIANRDNWEYSNDQRFTDLSSLEFEITVATTDDGQNPGTAVQGGDSSHATPSRYGLWLVGLIELTSLVAVLLTALLAL